MQLIIRNFSIERLPLKTIGAGAQSRPGKVRAFTAKSLSQLKLERCFEREDNLLPIKIGIDPARVLGLAPEQLPALGISSNGKIDITLLENGLRENGVPAALKLRQNEERNASNAASAIVRRLVGPQALLGFDKAGNFDIFPSLERPDLSISDKARLLAKYITAEVPTSLEAGELGVMAGEQIFTVEQDREEFCQKIARELYPEEGLKRRQFQVGVEMARLNTTDDNWIKTFFHLLRSFEREMAGEIKEIRDWKSQLPPTDPKKRN